MRRVIVISVSASSIFSRARFDNVVFGLNTQKHSDTHEGGARQGDEGGEVDSCQAVQREEILKIAPIARRLK